jgi:hypothetical protein
VQNFAENSSGQTRKGSNGSVALDSGPSAGCLSKSEMRAGFVTYKVFAFIFNAFPLQTNFSIFCLSSSNFADIHMNILNSRG